MKHVFIVCSPRTGGTWLGKLFDTSPGVKYLWEPNHGIHHAGDEMYTWRLDEPQHVRAKVEAFTPHVDIPPRFSKHAVECAVYKTSGPLSEGNQALALELARRFFEMRRVLDAKVIHLVRHPVRWAASVARWSSRDNASMMESIREYTRMNIDFRNSHRNHEWYTMVRHENVIDDPVNKMQRLFDFVGVSRSIAFDEFIEEMHSYDGPDDPHCHTVYARKSTPLDRWKTSYKNWFIVRYANEVTRESWKGIYEPLRG
jgi:hypothetical protein